MKKLALVVDDSRVARRLGSNMLSELGYRVMTAEDGQEAVRLAEEYSPSIILLDLQMPRMDGLEVCRLLRQHNSLDKTKVIVVTSKEDLAVVRQAFDAGCDAYLTKPLDAKNLEQVLRRMDGLAGTRDKLRNLLQ